MFAASKFGGFIILKISRMFILADLGKKMETIQDLKCLETD